MEEKNGPENMEEYQDGEGKRQIRKEKMAAAVAVGVAAAAAAMVLPTLLFSVDSVITIKRGRCTPHSFTPTFLKKKSIELYN